MKTYFMKVKGVGKEVYSTNCVLMLLESNSIIPNIQAWPCQTACPDQGT